MDGESSGDEAGDTSRHEQGDVATSQELDEGNESDDEDIGFPTLLTAGTPPLIAATVVHVPLLPEYPQTSNQGFAFCVPIAPNRSTPEQVLADALQVQYCKKQKGPAKNTSCPYIEGPAIRHRYECTGIKHCEHLVDTLLSFSHTHVTEETWEQMKLARQGAYRGETDIRKRKSVGLYIAVRDRFASQNACAHPKNTCNPILRQSRQQNVHSHYSWYIGCASWNWRTNHIERHYFRSVHDKYDVDHLQNLFRSGLEHDNAISDTCGVILGTRTSLPNCDVDHPQGRGALVHRFCTVKFTILIPSDRVTNPFFIFHSTGTHFHPPPPPSKTPDAITHEIVDLIKRMNNPSLTVASFLKGPLLEEFCRKHGKSSWGQVHATLNNLDRLRMTIYRENLIMFPAGQELQGVLFEWEKRHKDQEDGYIREINQSALGTVILTVRKKQAAILRGLAHFQIDLSFKRLKSGWHELLVAYFNESHGKLFTLCRIYMNAERRRLYSKAFTMLFTWVKTLTNEDVRWLHLHGSGIIGVTVDMDGKQMSGFGRYLHTQDPLARDWRWQLCNTIKLCEAHFRRGIAAACGSLPRTSDSVHHRMEALLLAPTWEAFQENVQLLIKNETPAIGAWAQQKNTKVIASGLNKNITLMPQNCWYQLEETSNHIEQSGKKGYSYGKALALLPAIMAGMKLDDRDIDQLEARDTYNVRHSYRATGQSARYKTAMSREKRAYQTIETPDDGDQSADDAEEAESFQGSSSGYPNARARSKRQRKQPTPRVSSSRSRAPSSSPASSTRSSQPVQMPLRTPSIEPSLQRQTLQSNTNTQAKRTELELREKEANIRRMELENIKMELEVEKMRRDMRD